MEKNKKNLNMNIKQPEKQLLVETKFIREEEKDIITYVSFTKFKLLYESEKLILHYRSLFHSFIFS